MFYFKLKTMHRFCTKCGAQNSDEAIYCQKCGGLLESEEETRIARSPTSNFSGNRFNDDDDELEIFVIRPTLLFVKIGYALAILGAFLIVALFSYYFTEIPAWIPVLLGLSLLLVPLYYHLRKKLVRYTLTDAKIEIDEGFISHTTRNVPLRTIQDVTVKATVAQRLLGFGDLVIENAGEKESEIVLKNINSPRKHADILLRQMRRLEK